MKFKTKEETIANKNKADRLFYDPYIEQYFIISPKKYIWKECEFDSGLILVSEEYSIVLNPSKINDIKGTNVAGG